MGRGEPNIKPNFRGLTHNETNKHGKPSPETADPINLQGFE
jgi:hypothetical protein